MAYEAGRKINRYTAKLMTPNKRRRRSREMKYYWNDMPEWWKDFYLSGRRTFCKNQTNRAIRRINGEIPSGAGYRRIFDYEWTIW